MSSIKLLLIFIYIAIIYPTVQSSRQRCAKKCASAENCVTFKYIHKTKTCTFITKRGLFHFNTITIPLTTPRQHPINLFITTQRWTPDLVFFTPTRGNCISTCGTIIYCRSYFYIAERMECRLGFKKGVPSSQSWPQANRFIDVYNQYSNQYYEE